MLQYLYVHAMADKEIKCVTPQEIQDYSGYCLLLEYLGHQHGIHRIG